MQTFDLHKWSPINQCRNGRFLVCPVHDARAAPAEKGRTGATPPFFPLYRQTGRGVCNRVCNNPNPPLFRGRSRPIDPCGKAPDTYPQRALTRRRQAP